MTDRAVQEHNALIAAGMRANEMSVFHALRLRGDPETGAIHGDLPTLARASGLSLRPFRKALRALESLGVVTTETAKRQGGPQGAAWVWTRRVQPRDRWAIEIGPPSVRRKEAVTVAATTKSNVTRPIATKTVSREVGVSHLCTSSSSGATAATTGNDGFFHQQGLHAAEVRTGKGAQAPGLTTLGVSGSDAVEVGGFMSSSATAAEGVRGTDLSALPLSGSDFGMGGLSSSRRSGQDTEAERIDLASGTIPSVAGATTWREIERPPEAPRKPLQAPNPKVVAEAVQRHCALLAVLQDAPGWPYDEAKDALMLAEAARMHPTVDLAFEVGQFYWWRVDHADYPPTRRGFGRFVATRAKYDRLGAEAQREWRREFPTSPIKVRLSGPRADTDEDHIDLILIELQDISDYPYDYPTDRRLVEQIVTEHPKADVLSVVWRWDTFLDDDPLTPKVSARASLRSFVRNQVTWGHYPPRGEVSK
jgi:hypothetical protein